MFNTRQRKLISQNIVAKSAGKELKEGTLLWKIVVIVCTVQQKKKS